MIDKTWLIAVVVAGLIAAAVVAPSIHPAEVLNDGTAKLSFNAELSGDKLCWTAGGWLKAKTYPDLWLQHLTVKLDGKVIFDKDTSGNGLMKSACVSISPGKHKLVMIYQTSNKELYVRKAWLGVDVKPHLAYNGMPYPGMYKYSKIYYNYPPNTDVKKVIITATITVHANESSESSTTTSTTTAAPVVGEPGTSTASTTLSTSTAPPPVTAPINPPPAPSPSDIIQAIIEWLRHVFHW